MDQAAPQPVNNHSVRYRPPIDHQVPPFELIFEHRNRWVVLLVFAPANLCPCFGFKAPRTAAPFGQVLCGSCGRPYAASRAEAEIAVTNSERPVHREPCSPRRRYVFPFGTFEPIVIGSSLQPGDRFLQFGGKGEDRAPLRAPWVLHEALTNEKLAEMKPKKRLCAESSIGLYVRGNGAAEFASARGLPWTPEGPHFEIQPVKPIEWVPHRVEDETGHSIRVGQWCQRHGAEQSGIKAHSQVAALMTRYWALRLSRRMMTMPEVLSPAELRTELQALGEVPVASAEILGSVELVGDDVTVIVDIGRFIDWEGFERARYKGALEELARMLARPAEDPRAKNEFVRRVLDSLAPAVRRDVLALSTSIRAPDMDPEPARAELSTPWAPLGDEDDE